MYPKTATMMVLGGAPILSGETLATAARGEILMRASSWRAEIRISSK